MLHIEVGVGSLHFARLDISPTYKTHLVIEEQIARRFALTHKKGGIMCKVLLHKLLQVGITQYIHVVNKELWSIGEQHTSMSDGTTRFEQQLPLIAKSDVWLVLAPRLNLVGKMVYVHDKVIKTLLRESVNYDIE